MAFIEKVLMGIGGFLIAGLIAGCSAQHQKIASLSVGSLPDFITQVVTTNRTYEADSMCVEISQRVLWEAGNRADDLSKHLTQNTYIVIDGRTLPENAISSSMWLTANLATDPNGGPSGSYGGEISFCFPIDFLNTGSHSGTLETQTMSGVKHTYSWNFETAPGSEVPITHALPTLALLPSLTPDD